MDTDQPKDGGAAIAELQERARRAELAAEQLRAELDGLAQRERFAGPEAQTLRRLAATLRWEEAPLALRLVLPLARLLRRGSRLSRPAPAAAAAPVAAPAAARPGGLKRRVLLAGYRLARPVALPVARRLHPLLTRLLQREAMLPHADAAPAAATAAATADLLRSAEAALLTLALRPRDRA